jgi:hypothetical protein
MKKTNVDFNPDDLLKQEVNTDFSMYMDKRLSRDQIAQATTLVIDDRELERSALDKLETAREYYDKLLPFRDRRRKCRDFYIGEHWNDTMVDPDSGETITMDAYIRKQNMVPIKQNQIRQHIKNLLGQYIENDFKSIAIARNREDQELSEMMSKTLEAALQLNDSGMLDLSAFEEFLISGAFGWKTYFGWHSDKNVDDLVVDTVHPSRMFFNTGVTDIRLKELDFIGEIHDVPINVVVAKFAKNEADRQQIRDWYGFGSDKTRRTTYTSRHQDSSTIDDLDFAVTTDLNMCRVVEIWEIVNMPVMIAHDKMQGRAYQTGMSGEELEQINEQRMEQFLMAGVPEENIPLIEYEMKFEDIWHFWFLTPEGKILMHGETPYDHEQTPYTLGLYPLVDGNIWGFAYDILDQQIQINRILTMVDKIIGTSAKGALLLPEQARADGWTNDDYANELSKSDGVLPYNANSQINPSGAKPEEMSTKNINGGALELLQIQMNLLEQISGVTNAIQGQKANSGTPMGMYQMQASNAQINNRVYFEFFFQRRSKRDLKAVKTIQQFYTEDRNIQTTGKDFDKGIQWYEAAKGRDIDIMISMGKATNTPVMRQIQEDVLLRFLESGLIDISTFTELTSMPFADKLRETITRKQQEMQEMQEQLNGQGMPTEADPAKMEQMQAQMGMPGGVPQGLQLN